MCLKLRSNCLTPWNHSRIRYKVADVYGDKLLSPCRYTEYKHKGWNVRKGYNGKKPKKPTTWREELRAKTKGFHVFVTKKQAKPFLSSLSVLMKVEVRGFRFSGTFLRNKSETWEKMRILKVYPMT